jgi:hypothetical protein
MRNGAAILGPRFSPCQARKQASSFSEEKEAKRLSFICNPAGAQKIPSKMIKVFWFFFSKKNPFLPTLPFAKFPR